VVDGSVVETLVLAYARWAAATGRVLGHPQDIRAHIRLDRPLRAMVETSASRRG